MKPIYAVMYYGDFELYSVGAYEDYQDAYAAMLEDLTRELVIALTDEELEGFIRKLIADAAASGDVLDDIEGFPGLSIEVSEDRGKVFVDSQYGEGMWEIVQIPEVIKHQDNKEDNDND